MEQPSYYGILPANVRYDKSLKANEKLLYCEVTSLMNKTGYCWASNKYFANLYGVTERAIKYWIKDLVAKNYLSSKLVYKNGNPKQVEKRILTLPKADTFTTPGEQNITTPGEQNFTDIITSSEVVVGGSKKQNQKSESKPQDTEMDVRDISDDETLKQHPLAYYQYAFGQSARGNLVLDIYRLSKVFGNELVNYAFKLAANRGYGYDYAKGILGKWFGSGIKTVAQAQTASNDFKRQRQKKANGGLTDPQALAEKEKARKLKDWLARNGGDAS